jgi:large subunit ribosomal protein L44e
MMKIDEEIKAFCKHCKKHTKHKVKKEKKGKTSVLSWGQRQYERIKKGHGSKRRGEVKVMKVNKGGNLILTCSECGKKSLRAYARTKKEPEIGKQ